MLSLVVECVVLTIRPEVAHPGLTQHVCWQSAVAPTTDIEPGLAPPNQFTSMGRTVELLQPTRQTTAQLSHIRKRPRVARHARMNRI